MKQTKSWYFLRILFILSICLFLIFTCCSKNNNRLNPQQQPNDAYVCNLSSKSIKELNVVLAKDDLGPKQNITGLNSNFVYDLDRSLAKDCQFIDSDHHEDMIQELGKIDSYYWNIDSMFSQNEAKGYSNFKFALNPIVKAKLKKIENLRDNLDFYWVYKNFNNNAKQLIIKKDNDFLSAKNCYFAYGIKYCTDIKKSNNIVFIFKNDGTINKIMQDTGSCGVIFKFKQPKNKNHSVFIKFLDEKPFNFIEKFTTTAIDLNHDLSQINYCFGIEKIGNDRFEDLIEKIIENDKSSPIWWAKENMFPYFIKATKNDKNDLLTTFVKFDDVASNGKNLSYLITYVTQLTSYLNEKIITPQHNIFLYTPNFGRSNLLNINGKKVHTRSFYEETKNHHASVVDTYNDSICKNIPILNNSIKLIDDENTNNLVKKCTYNCIFDTSSLQHSNLFKNLNEKELDYFFEYKIKNSIHRSKLINRDCCTKNEDGFCYIKFGLKVFGCNLYYQRLKMKFIDFNSKF